MKTIDFLDAAKARKGIPTDYGLAKALGVYPSAVKNYRAGRSLPDDQVAERLAELAGYDRGYVVVSIHAERAGETTEQGLWHHVLSHLAANGQAALYAVLAVILSLWISGGPDGAAMAATPGASAAAAAVGSHGNASIH